MLVEIYAQSQSGDYELLELFGDENINIKFVLKDSSDLSKVYSTYSQTFTIPAYGRNRRILRYYFDTPVVRTSLRYLNSKIYVNKELFKIGLISINEGTYKMGRQYSYNINFFTSLTNLKELFGDETLSQTLSNNPHNIRWSDGRTYLYTQAQVVNPDFDPDLIVPLVSNKRVWTYDDSGVNDIKYTGSINGVKHIQPSELRPAIPFSKIIDDIASSKGLVFKSPLFGQNEYEKLYVWCNGKNNLSEEVELNIINNFSYSGTIVPPWVDSSYQFINLIDNYLQINVPAIGSTDFDEIVFWVRTMIYDFEDNDITFQVVARDFDSGDIIAESDIRNIEDTTSDTSLSFRFYQSSISYVKKIKFFIKTSKSTGFSFRLISNMFITPSSGGPAYPDRVGNSLPNIQDIDIDLKLYDILPEIKTIDFISSFVKMFNISIIEDKFIINTLNFIPRNIFYTEKIDYTKYINIEEYKIKPSNLYKKINFKHKTSKYKSNVDFKTAIGTREYGELQYSSPDIQLKDEYKIETEFNIVPNRLIPNTNIQTFYGFLDESEDSVDYGKLWNPNTEDLTIFYYNGSQQLKDIDNNNISLNFKITEGGATIIEDLNTYNKVSIVYSDDPLTYINSLGYKSEVDVNDISFKFDKNLFTNYYEFEISKIYNPNSRLFEYNCILPTREINSFSLDKLIVIGDRKFTIEHADINIIDGKTKLTLMNVSPTVVTELNYIPSPPKIFTATLL